MIIFFFVAAGFFIKPGTGSHIYLAADNRLYSCGLCCFIKINHTIHHAMIGNGSRAHAKLLHTGYIFFNLIRAIQKRIFGMCV